MDGVTQPIMLSPVVAEEAAVLSQIDLANPDIEAMAPAAYPSQAAGALTGIVGEFVALSTEHSEADPMAVLASTLVAFGAMVGSQAHVQVGDSKHPPRLYTLITGNSAKARKGTSLDPVLRLLQLVEETNVSYGIGKIKFSHGPASSGEGLVSLVRDPSEALDKSTGEPLDPGVADKRALVADSEFASVFRVMQRDGNSVSPIIRTLFDHGNVEPITKGNKIKTTGAHVCMIGHITQTELLSLLQSVDVNNGLANRLLFTCARRQRLVPFPKPMNASALTAIAIRVASAVRKARERRAVLMHPDTAAKWAAIYPRLSADRPGVYGAVTARAEAQTLRLALIYALLDESTFIMPEHLRAALAFWQYCDQSARFIFGGAAPDPVANKILAELAKGERTQTALNELFNGHQGAGKLREILTDLQANGRIIQRKEGGGKGKGKAVTLWCLNPAFNAPSLEDFS